MENPFAIILEKLERIEHQIQFLNTCLTHPTSATGIGTELMNIKQVSEYLYLSVQTIYGFTSKLEIPHIKRGKRLYFKKEEIDAWLLKSRRKTREEIETAASNYVMKPRRFN